MDSKRHDHSPVGGREGPARDRRWLLVLAASACLVGLDALVVSPLAPQITTAASTARHLGGLLVTAYALAYMIASPAFGVLSDHRGRKTMMVAGLAVFGAGAALTGTGASFALLIVFRAVSGLGAAALVPSILAYISDKADPQRRGAAVSIIVGAMMGASVFGVPLGAFLAGAVSWRWTFWGIGILVALLLVALLALVPGLPPAHRVAAGPLTAAAGQLRAALASPAVLLTLLCTLLWTAGLPPQARGTVLALNYSAQYGGMMAGTAIAAALLDGGSPFWGIGIFCALCNLLVFPTVTVLLGRPGKAGAEAAERQLAAG
jgi:predicted MFS family arabinose efflux permease